MPHNTGPPTQRSGGPHQESNLALWTLVALLTGVPFTAILHHAVFYRPTCMLNPFGPDYNADTVARWLQNDPSLPIGMCGAAVIWLAGLWLPQLRIWIVGFLIAFLPLSIWIWDVPFTGRLICDHLHDERTPIRTRHLYLIGGVAWIPVVALLGRLQEIGRRRPSSTRGKSPDPAA